VHPEVKKAYAELHEAEERFIKRIREIFPLGMTVYWIRTITNSQNELSKHMQSGEVVGYREDGYVRVRNHVTNNRPFINPLRLEQDEDTAQGA